jgi:hypothetical protein
MNRGLSEHARNLRKMKMSSLYNQFPATELTNPPCWLRQRHGGPSLPAIWTSFSLDRMKVQPNRHEHDDA